MVERAEKKQRAVCQKMALIGPGRSASADFAAGRHASPLRAFDARGRIRPNPPFLLSHSQLRRCRDNLLNRLLDSLDVVLVAPAADKISVSIDEPFVKVPLRLVPRLRLQEAE